MPFPLVRTEPTGDLVIALSSLSGEFAMDFLHHRSSHAFSTLSAVVSAYATHETRMVKVIWNRVTVASVPVSYFYPVS